MNSEASSEASKASLTIIHKRLRARRDTEMARAESLFARILEEIERQCAIDRSLLLAAERSEIGVLGRYIATHLLHRYGVRVAHIARLIGRNHATVIQCLKILANGPPEGTGRSVSLADVRTHAEAILATLIGTFGPPQDIQPSKDAESPLLTPASYLATHLVGYTPATLRDLGHCVQGNLVGEWVRYDVLAAARGLELLSRDRRARLVVRDLLLSRKQEGSYALLEMRVAKLWPNRAAQERRVS